MLAMDMVAQRQQEQHHQTHSRCNKIPLQCPITLLHPLMFKWQCSNNSNNRWWWCIKVPIIITHILMIIISISSQLQVLLLLILLEISLPSRLRQAQLVRSRTTIIICSSRVTTSHLIISLSWFQWLIWSIQGVILSFFLLENNSSYRLWFLSFCLAHKLWFFFICVSLPVFILFLLFNTWLPLILKMKWSELWWSKV